MLVLGSGFLAGEEAVHEVEASLYAGFGSTEYFLDVNDGSTGVQSLLIFPTDALYAGVQYTYTPPGGAWQAEVALSTNITAPYSMMLDYDWFYYVGYSSIPFSYTESNLVFRALDVKTRGSLTLIDTPQTKIYLTGGYNLFFNYQLMTDYAGWQYQDNDSDGEYEAVYISSNADGIEYWVLFHMISAGAAWESRLDSSISLRLEAAPIAGLFFDSDDHLLRYKLSTASGFGLGISGNAALRYEPASSSASSWYAELYTAIRWFQANGSQRQYWYADGDQPEGTENTGIPHQVTLFDPQIGLKFGFQLSP